MTPGQYRTFRQLAEQADDWTQLNPAELKVIMDEVDRLRAENERLKLEYEQYRRTMQVGRDIAKRYRGLMARLAKNDPDQS